MRKIEMIDLFNVILFMIRNLSCTLMLSIGSIDSPNRNPSSAKCMLFDINDAVT